MVRIGGANVGLATREERTDARVKNLKIAMRRRPCETSGHLTNSKNHNVDCKL